MKLGFVYFPVSDLKEALRFYRDDLGWEELWREGEHTAALKIPGTPDVGLLLDEDPNERQAGPFLVVEDVVAFHERHRDRLKFLWEPREIPPGMYTAFADPSGNVVRLMDTTKDR